ncbi:unnamed protein product [Caenorhabditis brenneri]
MPKYYCDYCDAFLTHDSLKGRKTHNEGRRHKDNVRGFYQKWLEAQAQKLVDNTARAFTAQRMHGAVPRTTIGMRGPPMMNGPPGAYPPPAMYGPPGSYPPPGMMPPPMFHGGPPMGFQGGPLMAPPPFFPGPPMAGPPEPKKARNE